MSGTVRSWLHYCDVRTNADTQREHRQVAESCWQQLISVLPSLEM